MTDLKINLSLLSKAFLIFFIYLLVYYVFFGITTKPTEGDSLFYHIPIAKSIISGKFINPHYKFDHEYFPASSELVLAGFLFLYIPLNLYNILSVILLFFISRKLVEEYTRDKSLAAIAAVSVCTLNIMIRWISAQTVDIWLLVFYLLSLVFLLKPKNSAFYYLGLGFSLGMTAGTKYSGILYAIVLLAFYFKNFWKYINIKRALIFLLIFSTFSAFWYIRNYFDISNPFYPLDTPFFRGIHGNPIIQILTWKAIISYPLSMFNALFSEFGLWSLAIIFSPLLILFKIQKKLILLFFANFLLFLFLPSDWSYTVHVSNYRYGLPVFIPAILTWFIFASKYKMSEAVSLLAFLSMITLSAIPYHPKLVLFTIPLIFVLRII